MPKRFTDEELERISAIREFCPEVGPKIALEMYHELTTEYIEKQ